MPCLLCGQPGVQPVLELGPQPICNRFRSPGEAEERFELSLGQCSQCGTGQLTAGPGALELTPRFDWVTYTEPEEHLDDLAEQIASRLPIEAPVLGLTYKDDSWLDRMRTRGFRCERLDPVGDLGLAGAPGLESLQAALTPENARTVAARRGRSQVVIGRHIFEHSFAPGVFLAAAAELLEPSGWLLLEVPDCSRQLEHGDYTMIWEDHRLYFTEETFQRGPSWHGFTLEWFRRYPLALEDSLVAAFRRQATSPPTSPAGPDFGPFGRAFAERRQGIRSRLAELGPAALLGSGHLACSWVNYMDVSSQLVLVVDDNPHKQGLLFPGTDLVIAPSSALAQTTARCCVLGVPPQSEDRVIERNAAYSGEFRSLFPSSGRAL